MSSRLYETPLLYDRLRPINVEDFDVIASLLPMYANRQIETVLDPACGPGSWLRAFADKGYRVVGNDSSPRMCEEALRRLADVGATITLGNMADLPLPLECIDAAVEISGVACELSPRDFLAHVHSVGGVLRSGGLYIVCLLNADSRRLVHLPIKTWGRCVETGDRFETIEYFVEAYDEACRCVQVRRDVHENGVLRYRDRYALNMYDQKSLQAAVASIDELDLVASVNLEQPGDHAVIIQEILYVFRKTPSR